MRCATHGLGTGSQVLCSGTQPADSFVCQRPGFPQSNTTLDIRHQFLQPRWKCTTSLRCCMESYMVIASQKPQKAHSPQQFQTIQHFIIFFLKSVGGGEKKNHEVPEWMTHCRQNDKAVSEQMGGWDTGQMLPGTLTCTHPSIHSPFIHACIWLSVPVSAVAGTWEGAMKQNKTNQKSLFPWTPYSMTERRQGR